MPTTKTRQAPVPVEPQPQGREQPRDREQAEKLYPEVGSRIRTVGGTYPDRLGTVTGITDKDAQSGWLFLLIVDLDGGVKTSTWNVPSPTRTGTRKISRRDVVKERTVKLQPGSWEIIEEAQDGPATGTAS
jgi:hypothetical protein